ncbi:MAG TPA: hypothetical protein VK508_07670 [Cyclobacteriaceae bacterium]|nr:hypothetical protein [Cyclobacteriaceae bacterium]
MKINGFSLAIACDKNAVGQEKRAIDQMSGTASEEGRKLIR